MVASIASGADAAVCVETVNTRSAVETRLHVAIVNVRLAHCACCARRALTYVRQKPISADSSVETRIWVTRVYFDVTRSARITVLALTDVSHLTANVLDADKILRTRRTDGVAGTLRIHDTRVTNRQVDDFTDLGRNTTCSRGRAGLVCGVVVGVGTERVKIMVETV